MFENTKVMIRIEYEHDGIKRMCYGEIDGVKLQNFDAEEENYILMENNGKMSWVDKDSVISIRKLVVNSTVFERPRIDNYSQGNSNEYLRSAS